MKRRLYEITIPSMYITEEPINIDQSDRNILVLDNMILDGEKATIDLISISGGNIPLYAGMNLPMVISFINGELINVESDFVVDGKNSICDVGKVISNYFSFYIRPKNGKIGIEVRRNGKSYLKEVGTGFNLLNNADWHFITYTFNGVYMQVYLDTRGAS
ncbi:hypothetical protein EfmAA290_18000 [Enterococcus faecium]|nr:hypothetical protein EfmAA290_18000 [Enterococcus faecium]